MNNTGYRRTTSRPAWSRRVDSQLNNVMSVSAGELCTIDARSHEAGIACQRGSVWIAQDQDGRDSVLHAGQRFEREARGWLVLQALTAALLRATRQLVRRTWVAAVVVLAMASAIPMALDYNSGLPGFGVLLAVVLGLFARQVCEELRS